MMKKKQATGIGIIGLGSFLPDTVRTNDFWSQDFVNRFWSRIEQDPTIIEDKSKLDPFRGAKERRIISDTMDGSDMEVLAGLSAINDSGLKKEQIEALFSHSLVPDRILPLNPCLIQYKMKLSPIPAWTIDGICGSFVTQMIMACNLIYNQEYQHILGTMSAIYSRIVNNEKTQSVFVGDGAGAAVFGKVQDSFGYIGHASMSFGEYHDGIVMMPTRGRSDGLRWYCHNQSPIEAEIVNYQSAKSFAESWKSVCKTVTDKLFEKTGYTASDIDLVITTQGGAWCLPDTLSALSLDPSKGIDTFEKYANVGGAAVPINLLEARNTKKLKHGDIVLIYAVGAGLIANALLMRWCDTSEQ